MNILVLIALLISFVLFVFIVLLFLRVNRLYKMFEVLNWITISYIEENSPGTVKRILEEERDNVLKNITD